MAAPLPHQHIVNSWHEWEIDGVVRRLILVIETDVEMQPEADNYDPMLIEEVQSAAIAQLQATPSAINGIRIVPVRS